jgi:leucyl/phenylalanyl-tRNA--protein transferase
MFSLAPSASKLAMIVLARYMERMGLTLIDCQIETPHLRSMGGRYISYDHYMALLNGKDAAQD